MIKYFEGFEKERISNIDKYESFIPLIECIKCKKISFPPCVLYVEINFYFFQMI